MEDYENLKSLPTEIGKSEENVKKCFNEGFDKSKKEKESALKDEIVSIRAARDSELKTIEAEYKSNLTKLKSEIKESKERQGRKEYKDMNSQELDAEYQRVLAEVQRLDDRLRENRREDADKIPGLRNQLDGFRSKLAEIGRIRKAASGGNRYHHRTIRKIR
jgi:chromosome segregation ATPase